MANSGRAPPSHFVTGLSVGSSWGPSHRSAGPAPLVVTTSARACARRAPAAQANISARRAIWTRSKSIGISSKQPLDDGRACPLSYLRITRAPLP